jgi:hypothetical protein
VPRGLFPRVLTPSGCKTEAHAETIVRILTPWYEEALLVVDDAAAQRLAEKIRKTLLQ